jgi:choline transport protein
MTCPVWGKTSNSRSVLLRFDSRLGQLTFTQRIFRQSTMIMFTSMVQGTWETVLVANTGGMINGGLAGLFWGYVWTFIGFFSIVMSLAEMASM